MVLLARPTPLLGAYVIAVDTIPPPLRAGLLSPLRRGAADSSTLAAKFDADIGWMLTPDRVTLQWP